MIRRALVALTTLALLIGLAVPAQALYVSSDSDTVWLFPDHRTVTIKIKYAKLGTAVSYRKVCAFIDDKEATLRVRVSRPGDGDRYGGPVFDREFKPLDKRCKRFPAWVRSQYVQPGRWYGSGEAAVYRIGPVDVLLDKWNVSAVAR